MAFLRTTVTGRIYLPDGSVMPDGANIIFTLRSWDKDADLDAVALPGPIVATVEDGAISVQLIRTASTDGQVTYDVGYIYRNPWTQLPVPGRLGIIAVSGAGPLDLDDILAVPAPVPNVPDALAQAIAAALDAVNAAESANNAALMALVGTGTGFDSVQQMKDSTITYGVNSITHNGEAVSISVEAGDRWVAKEGLAFDVLASEATLSDLETGGGVKLDAADDATSANIVGAADGANPNGRGSSAPALVTSMKRRKLYGVTLRDLLGRNYAGTFDGAAALNGFLPELAPEGIGIHDPHNLKVLLGEPLRPESGMKLALGPATKMSRGYSDSGSDTGALISRANWSVDTDDWEISGGIWTTASSAQTGKLFNVYGSRWKFTNARFLDWYGGACFTYGGDDFLVMAVSAFTQSATSGNDAFRMIGGARGRAIGLMAETYDDCFAIGTISNNENPRFNIDIEDFYYIGCTGISNGARLGAAFVAGPQSDNDMTSKLRNAGWIGCGGVAKNRAFSIENSDGDGTVQRQIDNVVARDCSVDVSEQIATTPVITNAISVISSFDGGVGRVTLDNVKLKGNNRDIGIFLSNVKELVAINCDVTGEKSAFNVVNGGEIVDISGGRYGVESNGGTAANGGGSAPDWVAEIGATAGDVQVKMTKQPRFYGVATSKAAVRLSSSTAIARLGDVDVTRAVGATGVIGISYAAGSAVDLGVVTGDFDTAASGSGYLTHRGVGSVTAAQLADATHPVNLKDKTVNKIVFETTNDRIYRATGPGPTDPWNASDGSGGAGNITPSVP